MTSTTPIVNGQLIGLTHYASRALLERVLARSGTTFPQSVALRAIADNGGDAERAGLVDRVTAALKFSDDAAARLAVEELVAAKLLDTPTADRVSLTDSGRELFDSIQAGGREIASQLYAGIPQEDLETAGRVLTVVLERANAELAAV
ncbi:MarR family winged helix-turn-helix transcriptional regulator [Streptomyces yaanensis]|uniref:MarR family winged helix-turn-helix transcriptional regulator n=1 Tax=Streptomyces yaanensis TaxID=1142239 RepID=A0ABV7SAL5_9ACTN|nr:MarR family transcriptional regulator [Streptomyces sp. CGMCC 4.7035]WNC00041.1 MarR family transcriptional regulator [Streptomyces sp. CGMCC 4.7035]